MTAGGPAAPPGATAAAGDSDGARGRSSDAGLEILRERFAFYLGFLVGGIWFLLCSALGIVWLLARPRNRQTLYVYGRVFCRGVVRLMGWEIAVEHRERMETTRPCVIVANHQSFADVVTFGSVFPRRTVSAGKRQIGRIPVFGWFYRLSGNLIIDREHARSAFQSLEGAAQTVRAENLSVWFMPEGHRNLTGQLLPFKSGAFRLAIAAGVPVLPIVASPLPAILDTRRRRARPGRLDVRVLEPVSTAGMTPKDVPELTARVRSTMQAALDGLDASVG
ncbi:MAG TPA: lysophospholipid acyltransferase family protein [Thermoanaerobaculia bacterium]|nr:lysophospholipid acyltransferase family protein [Thermoanaerobaculia bacterium]